MLESSIYKYICKKGGSFSFKDLAKQFEATTEQEKDYLKEALYNLEMDGKIFLTEKNNYIRFPRDFKLGKLEMSRNGKGRVRIGDDFIYIDSNDLNNAIDRDIVIINNYDEYTGYGRVKKVLKRERNTIVCEYIKRENGYTIKPQISNKKVHIKLDEKELKNLVDGDYIKVDMSIDENGNVNPTIKERIGHRDDPDIDIKNIAAEYDIEIDFSKEALDQLESIPTSIEGIDISNRVDLRDKNFVTIDCFDTKDMDDAVYIEGNKLYVSIADVAEFIKPGTPLANEILNRSTSWYPPHKVVPQLPHIISNGICSLNPGEDRLTITCEMTLDDNGKVKNSNVYLSVINSKKKMTYNDVNKILEEGIIPEGYEEYVDILKQHQKVAENIGRIKAQSGYIDFYRPEPVFEYNEDGEIINIKPSYQHTAEKIIENEMVLSNVETITFLSYIFDTLIYRVHDFPDEEKLTEMMEFVNSLNLGFKVKSNKLTSKELQDVLEKIKGKEYAPVVSELILRSMKRARYDTNNIGHYALGNLLKYSHTTSPIRRSVDYVTQVLIHACLNNEYNEEVQKLIDSLQDIAEYASHKERQAKEAEMEADKMIMAEYMAKQEGRFFEAVISNVNETGAYARINDVIEGKIYLRDIEGDSFHFDPKRNILIGKRTKETIEIGQKRYVQVKSASKENRTINYKICNTLQKDTRNNKEERRNKVKTYTR